MTDLFASYRVYPPVDMAERVRLLVYLTNHGLLTVEEFMAQFVPTKEQVNALCEAIDLKLASLKRAQKGASSAFEPVYEAEIRMYNSLIDLVRGAGK